MQSVLVDRESLNLSLDRKFRFSTFNCNLITVKAKFPEVLVLGRCIDKLTRTPP